jgi:hypothetical protein
MKKRISFLFSAFLLAAALVIPGSALAGGEIPPEKSPCFDIELANPSNQNKATLCHFTGSASNPVIVNEVGASAVNSHFGHHGDCYRFYNQAQVCVP